MSLQVGSIHNKIPSDSSDRKEKTLRVVPTNLKLSSIHSYLGDIGGKSSVYGTRNNRSGLARTHGRIARRFPCILRRKCWWRCYSGLVTTSRSIVCECYEKLFLKGFGQWMHTSIVASSEGTSDQNIETTSPVCGRRSATLEDDGLLL